MPKTAILQVVSYKSPNDAEHVGNQRPDARRYAPATRGGNAKPADFISSVNDPLLADPMCVVPNGGNIFKIDPLRGEV